MSLTRVVEVRRDGGRVPRPRLRETYINQQPRQRSDRDKERQFHAIAGDKKLMIVAIERWSRYVYAGYGPTEKMVVSCRPGALDSRWSGLAGVRGKLRTPCFVFHPSA